MFRQVQARATVDVIKAPVIIGGFGIYNVEVWGNPPYDYTRRYEIHAKNDNLAAQEGLHRFVKEMENLNLSKD